MALRFLVNSVERDDILTMPLDLAQVVAAEAHRAAKRVFASVFFPTVPMLVFLPRSSVMCPRNASRLASSAFWRSRPQSGQRHKMLANPPEKSAGMPGINLRKLS